MPVTILNIIAAKFAEPAQVTQYTATNATTIIDKFTVANISASDVAFSVNLVIAGGSAGSNNRIINEKVIAASETYTCPELIGHVLNQNGFISTLAGTASTLVIRASGREIT